MKTTVKNLSDTKVELFIECDSSELEAAQAVAVSKLAKTVKVPGFRAGKVPANVAAKHIDPNQLAQETLENALSKAVAEAFLAEDLQALDRPAVEVKKYVPGQSLEFTAEVEVLPKVTLGDYKTLKAKKEKVKLDASEIDDVIERMRTGMAQKQPVEREAKDGDEVKIDFVGKLDGEAFEGGTGNDYDLKLGSNTFIPGFESGVVGHKAGETFDVEVKFPDDYHAADLKGKPAVFTVTLKEVNEVTLPEVNDEFAAKAGPFTSADELRADIERELTQQKERSATDKLKDDLVAELIDKSDLTAPEVLVQDQMRSIEQDMSQNLMYQGLSLDQYLEAQGFADRETWQDKEVKPAAEKRVKAGLVLAELSKQEKIEATDKELEEHVALYKQQYGGADSEAAKQFDTPEARQQIANRLLTEKTVDRLVELNTKAKK